MSFWPRMYVQPKAPMTLATLKPILYNLSSVLHGLTKSLSELLQPVSDPFFVHTISESFRISNFIRYLEIESENKLIVAFTPSHCIPMCLFINRSVDALLELI